MGNVEGTSHASHASGVIGRRELLAPGPGRIDAVLAELAPDLSRARLQRLIAAGEVLLNGEPARKSAQVWEGDSLTLTVPPTDHGPSAPAAPIPVLYEDEWLVVIDKPPGLASHGAPGDTGPSVAGWFIANHDASAFDVERPGLVHRLDKDTSGVMVLAKTPTAQAALSAAFEARTTDKRYLAITEGIPNRPRAMIEAAIGRHPGDRTRMAIAKRGREARTEYEVLGADRDRAFVLVHLHTGRTHQARVHLAAINCPVAFDRVYGKGGDGRQQLHAWRLSVPHPAGGLLTVSAPLPADMRETLRAMGLDELASAYLTSAIEREPLSAA